MATLKLTIDGKRSYADGRVPIIYRLTHKTQTTRIESGVKVLRHEWDTVKSRVNKIHPESKALNIILGKKLLLLEKRLLEHTSEVENISLSELKELLLNGSKTPKTNFYSFAIKEVQILQQQQRFGNAEAYETATNRLVQFTGKELILP